MFPLFFRFFFLCGRWLAVEEDDGAIQRLLPVAGQNEVNGFHHLFHSSAKKKLTDDHLWLSVVIRPSRSSFTRLQRLTCCFSLLFLTMIANAMWYRSEDTASDQVIKIGPVILSVVQLYISLMSNLVIFPASIVIVMFFQKSRPKPIHLYLRKLEDREMTSEEISERKRLKRKYPLPYWCTFVAWFVAIAAILASSVIVIFYSLQWGKEKAESWLSSLLLSFLQSVVMIQPLKVSFPYTLAQGAARA